MFLIAACSASPGSPTAAPATATPGPGVTAAPTVPPVGPTNAPPTGAAVDVCALLSPEDLSAATGKDYLPGLPDDFGQCYWDGNQVGTGNGGDTIVGAVNVQELAFIKSAFGAGGSDVSLAGRHPAFYNPTEGLGSLWVDLGNGSLLVLSVPTSGDLDPSYERILVQLALAALSKM
ncbi:MAG: DUF3558 family protein [Chloroflexota bacterium]